MPRSFLVFLFYVFLFNYSCISYAQAPQSLTHAIYYYLDDALPERLHFTDDSDDVGLKTDVLISVIASQWAQFSNRVLLKQMQDPTKANVMLAYSDTLSDQNAVCEVKVAGPDALIHAMATKKPINFKLNRKYFQAAHVSTQKVYGDLVQCFGFVFGVSLDQGHDLQVMNRPRQEDVILPGVWDKRQFLMIWGK